MSDGGSKRLCEQRIDTDSVEPPSVWSSCSCLIG